MSSVEIDLFYGLIGTFLFIFRNSDKRYIYRISTFIIGLFVSEIAYFYFNVLPGQVIWVVSALGLIISYSMRLKDRTEKGIMEIFKVVGLMLLILYPLPFYSIVKVGENSFLATTRMLTFFILGTIYVYDRLILKPEKMKKKYIIALVAQSVFILLLLTFSFIQKAEADKSRQLAQEQEMKAIEMQKKAMEIEAKYKELVRESAR
jgi:hypothetical protein